eukprot:5123849-Pyramimonas_sp.AAC.1
MRAPPLGPSARPMGPRNAVLSGGNACGHGQWGLWWSSLWGHETMYQAGETHANTATGTFGGALSGTTECCTGWGKRMRTPPLGP